jgi:hypothetical protein
MRITPTFSDYFKSFYYSNNYLLPVDLSDKKLAKYLLAKENPQAAAIAQKLISNREVQEVLSAPLSFDMAEEIPKKNAILQKHGFKLLGSKADLLGGKIPYYSVVEHDELQGWIIKSAGDRVRKGELVLGPYNDRNEMAFFTKQDSLLRIEMAKRIQKIAKKANIDIILPKKKLVAYSNLNGATEPNKKYCVVCEKLNILSVQDTVQTIKDMGAKQQKDIARKISTIVQKAGLVDASFDNIRLTLEGKLAFIDTEPVGLMVAKKSVLWNNLGLKGSSIERCARIGLFNLMRQSATLNDFHKQIKSDYEKATIPKLSKWKITLSVLSLGLIPLINVIVALVKAKQVKELVEKIGDMDLSQTKKVQNYIAEKVPEANNSIQYMLSSPRKKLKIQRRLQKLNRTLKDEQFVKDYQKKRLPMAKQYYSFIENVPYKALIGLI